LLYDQGYGEQDILELHNFLDWLMRLPEDLEKQFQIELEAFEEAKQMKYVTVGERRAEERGKISERIATQTEIARNMLQQNLAIVLIAQVTGLSIEQVQTLQSQAEQN
jgi:predicted transposase/invertase (TIGR01784 family)